MTLKQCKIIVNVNDFKILCKIFTLMALSLEQLIKVFLRHDEVIHRQRNCVILSSS